MRTTLSLADDVAVKLQTAQKQQGKSFRKIVNDALRDSLARQSRTARRKTRFRTATGDFARFPGLRWENPLAESL